MSVELARETLRRLAAAGVTPTGLTANSRKVRRGDVFAAWPGMATDGRLYIDDAIARGAAAILREASADAVDAAASVPIVDVVGLRNLAGYLAHEIHGHPSSSLWLTGVTGTNGKTTVTQWLAASLTDLGQSCGVIGTLGSGYPGTLEAALNTTPDAPELHRQLGGFVADRAAAVAMEVSSIGLEQGRVNAVAFDVAVFTNLSRDHLDYHGDMVSYGKAKARLFDAPGLGHVVINLDDDFGLAHATRLAAAGMDVIGYTLADTHPAAHAGVRVLAVDRLMLAPAGMRFSAHWQGLSSDVQVRMVAPFNVSNLLAVIGSLLARGVELDDALRVVTKLTPPEGRMQLLGGVCEPLVVIDYAHSPDALAKVLEAVACTVKTRGGRLICLFGCGGDRDPGKRPLMGEVASALADRVIITSDNPRTEDPAAIIEQIRQGAGTDAESVIDRSAAISLAIGEAGANDVVVLAGKGHEPYQETLGRRIPFSDVAQARAALRDWNRLEGQVE